MEKKDYYVILGVSHEETPGGIRAAYRDRVKKLHPDLAGEESTRDFQELTEAYRVLSDPERRSEYNRRLGRLRDRGAAPPRQRWPEPARKWGGGPLRQYRAERSEPLHFEVLLSPEEAARGCVVPLGIPVYGACPRCGGSGEDWGHGCPRCSRAGVVEQEVTVELQLPPGVASGSHFRVSLDALGAPNLYLCLRVFVAR